MARVPRHLKPPPVSARTVVVACKIPTGLVLQLQKPVDRMQDQDGGPKPVRFWQKHGIKYVVNGPGYPVGTLPKGFPRAPMIEGGYAITRGIPADFWEQWLEQNKLAPYVQVPEGSGAEHGMIFAYADLDDAVAASQEQEKLMSGLEPLSTDEDTKGKLTDPRLPRPNNMAVGKIAHEPHPTS